MFKKVSSLLFVTTAAISINSYADQSSLVRGQSVYDRERPDYDSRGVNLGAFTLNPSLNVQQTYDDNIFATDGDEVEDNITRVKPGLNLKSDWSRHEVSVGASGDFGFHYDNDNENYEDYNLNANARVDLLRETYLYGGVFFDQLHEDRGSADDVNGVDPTEYTVLQGNLGFYKGLRRFTLKVDGSAREIDFDDVLTSGSSLINNDDRDRKILEGSVRVGYEIVPNYEAYVRGTINQRDYDEDTDDNGINRDSDGYEAVIGTALDISGKVRGDIYLGYLRQEFDSSALSDADGIGFGANVLWNATSLTSLKARVDRSIDETTINNASSYINTGVGLTLEHELRRNVLTSLNLSYALNDYEGIAREDDFIIANPEIRYLINRNVSVSADYNYAERESNVVNQDYKNHQFTVGLKLAL